MPASPQNRHVCVCGFKTSQFDVLRQHKTGCDSWKEHRERIEAEGKRRAEDQKARDAKKTEGEQGIVKWECLHVDCTAFSHTFHDLITHMKFCSLIRESINTAFQETELGLGDFGHELDLLVAFDQWCRENGRV